MLLDALRATLSPEIGLDLGTANTVVYQRGSGVILSEPSVVAFNARTEEVLAVGRAAKEMEGRAAPGRVRVVRPLQRRDDFRFSRRADAGQHARRPRAGRAAAAPTADDRLGPRLRHRHRVQGGRAGGTRRRRGPTTFVPQAVAAAVGAGLDISTHRAQMVVDIGGGTTEVAILSLYGVVRLRSFQLGGDELDRAIVNRLGAERFLVGPLTAEALKIGLGFAGRPPGRAPMWRADSTSAAGAPRSREIPEASSARRWAMASRRSSAR